uniref:C2H2-type domain-containing protein n=1 Tax=Plectus sambesii TaxID=2011161 RepID=A0A914WAY8_9BILA
MSSSAINESPYNCTECGASKKSEEALELHLKVSHLKWLPFKCPKCTAQRALESQMRNHIQINNHGDPSKPNVLDMKKHGLNHVLKPIFMCPHCNFNRQFEISGVKAHMRMKHPDSSLQLIDNSSLYADDIKKCLQFCFPGHFGINEDAPRDAPLPAKSLEGSEEEWIVVKDATCAICNQL